MVTCGKWKDGAWGNFRAERNILPQFQGDGARPWALERRGSVATGMC